MPTPTPKYPELDHQAVLAANTRFYDSIAGVYDQVDRRRQVSEEPLWLIHLLGELQGQLEQDALSSKGPFLDAGAGSGFLSKQALKVFPKVIALDASQAMLDRLVLPGIHKVKGDCSQLPFADNTFSTVGAFATLHHLFEPAQFFREAFRVLKRGGVLYTDHDIEASFVANFRAPLKLYRFFYDHGPSYLRACPTAQGQDYCISEFHGEQGLSGPKLTNSLQKVGFTILREQYHWEGMGIFAKFFARPESKDIFERRGRAPIVRILARKD